MSWFLTCSIIVTQMFPAVPQKEIILPSQPLIINNPLSFSFMIQNDPARTNKMVLCRSCQRINSTQSENSPIGPQTGMRLDEHVHVLMMR